MWKLVESGGLQHHIFHTLQPAYARRYRSMIDAVEEYLIPLGVTMPQSDRKIVGGYFIWISLPAPLQAERVAAHAKEENLIIAPGHLFAVRGDEKVVNLDRQVRLCFSWEDEDKLADGVRRLGHVIKAMIQRETITGQIATAHRPGDRDHSMETYR